MASNQPNYRYQVNALTVNPATAIATPATFDCSPGLVELVSLQVQIPPGPRGAVGFQVWLSGSAIVPWQGAGVWVIEDDAKPEFDIGMQVDSLLVVKAYNLGVYPHTLSFRWKLVDNVPAVAPVTFTPIASSAF